MGLLNSHQVLPGARTGAGDKTYALAGVKTRPTASVAGGVLSFTGGSIEIEGRDYTFAGKSLDFNALGTLPVVGATYAVAAVPSYNEPATQAAAEAAGLNYYVQRNPFNEFLAYPFIPANLQAAVANEGGLVALTQRIYLGTADASDIAVYNQYSEAAQRLIDPRYAIFPLAPIGFEFVLAQVVPQDNSAKPNALLTKTQADFNLFRSQVGLMYTERKVLTVAEANARYAGRTWLIQSARSYANVNDAISDTSGTTVTPAATGNPFTGTVTLAVVEYTYPSNLPIGQTGREDAIIRFLTKEDSSVLGRINPIYLENERVSVRYAKQPSSRLTLYGDPCGLVKVTVGGTAGALTLSALTDTYDTFFN